MRFIRGVNGAILIVYGRTGGIRVPTRHLPNGRMVTAHTGRPVRGNWWETEIREALGIGPCDSIQAALEPYFAA